MSKKQIIDINTRLAEVSKKFKLKIKLTVDNARQIMEENYKTIRLIDKRITHRLYS